MASFLERAIIQVMFTCIICIMLIIVSDNFSINHVHLVSFFKIECTSYPSCYLYITSFLWSLRTWHALIARLYVLYMYSAYNPKENPREPFIWSIVVWHVDLNIFHGRYEYDSFSKIQELYLTTDNMQN